MDRNEWMLVWLLRLTAAAMLLAVVPALMPMAWMDWAHRRMGLGPMPDGPVVEYLARSTSAFYAMFGGLLWLVSCDVRRHGVVLRYVAWVGAGFSIFITAVDALAGLPALWTWSEGPLTLLVCVAILVLESRVRRAATAVPPKESQP